MCCEWVFVFLDTRPSALMLGPRPPSYRSSAPKILQEQIHELSILLIQDYTYSRLYLFKIKTLHLFKIFKKQSRKAKLWCPK